MNDRDVINQRVLNGMVHHLKAEEADRLNGLGVEAQLAYVLRDYTVEDLLQIFANPIDPEKRESAALTTIDRLCAASGPTDYPVECIDELLVIFEHVPEIHDELHTLIRLLSVIDKITVECSQCHRPVPRRTAHLHEEKYIGDECCWSKALPMME